MFAFLNTTAQYYCWASVKYEGNLDGTMLSEIAGKIQALASKIAASVAK